MSRSPAHNLITVITHWRDLDDALGAPAIRDGFGQGLRQYLARLDEEPDELHHQHLTTIPLANDRVTYACAHCDHVGDGHAHTRSEDRDPAQLGARPLPLRVTILDTMEAIHAQLLECADAIAEHVQRPVMGLLPAGYSLADRQRRELLAMRDRHDPRRWRWTGTRPTAPLTALWLLGRIQAAPGPFRPLTEAHRDRIASVARGCARQVETALDIAAVVAPITKPCPDCGGGLRVHGGAGADPTAHCSACGRTWTTAPAA